MRIKKMNLSKLPVKMLAGFALALALITWGCGSGANVNGASDNRQDAGQSARVDTNGSGAGGAFANGQGDAGDNGEGDWTGDDLKQRSTPTMDSYKRAYNRARDRGFPTWRGWFFRAVDNSHHIYEWFSGGRYSNREGHKALKNIASLFEYDVNACRAGREGDRGTVRIIVEILQHRGRRIGGRAWFTTDHYRTITQFDPRRKKGT